MNNRRIQRLLAILQALAGGAKLDVTALEQQCGVSRRTVFRDLETLRSVGVELEFDAKNGRYWLPDSTVLPATNFTTAEALALLVVTREFARGEKTKLHEAASYAADKIEASLPNSIRDELVELSSAISLVGNRVGVGDTPESIYDLIVAARQERRVVKLRYQSLTEWEEISTKLRPYQLLFCRHSWYVIGRSSLHREIRTFKLQRILSATLLQETFRVPKDFRLQTYLGNAWTMVPESGADLKVRIRFSPLVAHNVAEVVWHPTQQLTWNKDGSLLFKAEVSGANEISWWILGYGDQAEVLGPARLRNLVAERVRAMSKLYKGKQHA